ncbi:helix-turn-helix domain-containing protein [Idiomarina sp. UBA4520]|uniref:helix-turn-helix domain-containing protein n=1 Tax=Idiomarina sp. UBA4520 TaxID=1946647 RepID=UPI000B0F88BD|nr:helix-turn-helix domain-containing protein [Idiomarina sp. UBA4520]
MANGKSVRPTPMPDLTQPFSAALLAEAITAKRTTMHLRLVDVAKTLSLSRQTLVKIEKGDPRVNFVNVLRVMNYLGLSFRIVTDTQQHQDNELREPDSDWF